MKIFTVIGARPQFIKASVVSHAIVKTAGLTEVLVHTGQHFDANMSEVFFDELGIKKPEYFLDINRGTHGRMTGRMLESVEKIMIYENPDVVLVYGDTNSTLAGSLAAAKLQIPIAHVEAGLRSFNMSMPEEINRILTDRVSQWLFTPTKAASENLKREGFSVEKIIEVGDVMYDVAQHFGNRMKPDIGLMRQLGLTEKNYVLATIHRQENTNQPDRLTSIVDALITTAKTLPVVWPLHPRTRALLQKSGLLAFLESHVKLIEPIGYLDMVQLEKYAAVIATDSGGVQKEAFFYQVPCVTLRDETEWIELVEAGWNRLARPSNSVEIQQAINQAIGTNGKSIKPYGSGNASMEIVRYLAGKK